MQAVGPVPVYKTTSSITRYPSDVVVYVANMISLKYVNFLQIDGFTVKDLDELEVHGEVTTCESTKVHTLLSFDPAMIKRLGALLKLVKSAYIKYEVRYLGTVIFNCVYSPKYVMPSTTVEYALPT